MDHLPTTWAALCALAFVLGAKHGFDADHLATIDGLTRYNARTNPRLARFCGTLFSLGHGAIVLLVALAAGALEELKKLFSRAQTASGKWEDTMADKKMMVEEVNEYMKKQCGFVPRMFQIINTVSPEPGRTFADFYASIFGDGALSRKHKVLMFMAGGVAYCSPRCIIHVIPAFNAGANDGEIFEAESVGMILGGFVPGGPGIPYAFEYALKCIDIAGKYCKGEKWEYLPQPKFDHGVF